MAKKVMSLADSVEVARPAAEVFAQITDLPALLSKLRRRKSAEVERLTGGGGAQVGDKWRITGTTRLGQRSGTVAITGLTPPGRIELHAEGRGFGVDTILRLEPMGDDACRMSVTNQIFAMTFAARLLAPGVRLWRRQAEKGLRKGLKRLKKGLER